MPTGIDKYRSWLVSKVKHYKTISNNPVYNDGLPNITVYEFSREALSKLVEFCAPNNDRIEPLTENKDKPRLKAHQHRGLRISHRR